MTGLIDPRAIQAIRQRRSLSSVRLNPAPLPTSLAELPIASDDWRLSDRQLATLKPRDILTANNESLRVLLEGIEDARALTDGREMGAPLMMTALRLLMYASERFAAIGLVDTRANIEAVVRAKLDEVLRQLWKAMLHSVSENAEREFAELEGRLRAELSEEREQATAGVDAAQAEASQARRELERERAAWQVEKDHLLAQIKHGEQQLGKLRYDTDKRTQRLEADARDVPRLQGLVGDLDRQVFALKEEKRALCTEFAAREDELLAELDALTHPSGPAPLPPTPISQEESAMTQTASLNAHLAAMSLAVFLRGQGLNVCSEGARVMGEESPRRTGLEAEWASAYPTDAARLAHLREVAAPLRRLLAGGQAA